MAKVWNYGTTYSSREVFYFGLLATKAEFVEAVAVLDSDHTHATRNWISRRVSETGNNLLVKLATEYPNRIIVIGPRRT